MTPKEIYTDIHQYFSTRQFHADLEGIKDGLTQYGHEKYEYALAAWDNVINMDMQSLIALNFLLIVSVFIGLVFINVRDLRKNHGSFVLHMRRVNSSQRSKPILLASLFWPVGAAFILAVVLYRLVANAVFFPDWLYLIIKHRVVKPIIGKLNGVTDKAVITNAAGEHPYEWHAL